jgi:RNA polymerase sigma factor (sigma-70 family)
MNDLDDVPDAGLSRRFLEGDERAFRALHARHAGRLRAVIMRLLGDRRSETDDVVQEAWLAACRGMHTFRGESRFSTWLTTIGIRAVRTRLRRRNDLLFGEVIDDVPCPDGVPLTTLIDLERAIATLPDHQRVVLVLHDVEGFTHEEIARELGCAEGTSKATLSRARQAVRMGMTEGVRNAV